MSIEKPNLYDVSWKVSEEEYRKDNALSYSTLARFAREGFTNLDKLFDKVESSSLTFGSAVDALITGGQEEFDTNFIVAEFPPVSESIIKMVVALFKKYNEEYRSIELIPTNDIIALSEELKYQLNWKPETRVKVIREQGNEYYSIMYAAQGKKILDNNTYDQVLAAVYALKSSESTSWYFEENSPFNEDIRRYYQLKFRATFEGIDYRCMADLIVVNHADKTIQPIDLKTSSHAEWDFYKSFVQWGYQIQARLYWRIIKEVVEKSELFEDYIVLPYKFIVVNKNTLTPLVWEFEDTSTYGNIVYGNHEQTEFVDPFTLGKELHEYLTHQHRVPLKININKSNSITEWLMNG
ncbi:MAG: hypothetical protein IJU02_07465 [Lachnospiraceae bacterium]|nr:hypothetical protein [Lachnospiraceae bacterium]